ncbi:sigma 54-interacting transcriptional regulator, partial [candidate division KSB1 bacterium]|nr:sigma 54-interacting transcriptional regulator [candidate division KSB1 bacterium]
MKSSNTHEERLTTEDLICNSDVMKKVRQEVRLVVDGEDPVLITGEEGNGKRLLARTIH